MAVQEDLGGLGSWELALVGHTPDDVIAKLGYMGHVVIVDGPVDVEATGNALLSQARYVGVCREIANTGGFMRGGEGLLFWLSDEEGKGWWLESAITLTNATLLQAVTALLPPTVTLGTVHAQPDPGQRYTNTHQFQSRREALGIMCDTFGVELRVNTNFTVDVGTAEQLYDAGLPLAGKPSPIIIRRGAGSDIDVVAIAGQVQTEGSARDYTTRTVLLGQTIGTGDEPDEVFVTATVESVSPYKDPQGNPVKLTRVISESGETEGSAQVRVQLHHNRFFRTTQAIKVTADDYDIEGSVRVGDAAYVYDPDSGIVDAGNEVTFHGEVLHPAVVRVSTDIWPIVEGYTVAWKTDGGEWIDLTRWVVWETGDSGELTVGDSPKTLSRGGASNPIQDRVDAARPTTSSTKTPKAPTGLTLTTTSALNPVGDDAAVITAEWNPVTQNTDNTVVSLSHYELQYRPQFRAPIWLGSAVTTETKRDLSVVPGLAYDVQVRAVSTGGKVSAWTSIESITSATDSIAPGAPADPVLTNIRGEIRVHYTGLTAAATPMPADANRVDVEVGPSAAGPWTVESSLTPFAEGIHFVMTSAPATRWVRLVAYDHNGNASAPSAAMSAATALLGDADIANLSVAKLTAGTMTADVVMAGRHTTALTGARREMNAVGFQAWDSANNLTISLDGVNNLLTGRFRTALTGRRIDLGAAGASGELLFYAPDGTTAKISGYTSTTDPGVEVLRMSILPDSGSIWPGWPSMQVESDGAVGQAEFRSYGALGYLSVGGNGPEPLKGFYVLWATNRGTATTAPAAATRMFVGATANNHFFPNGGTFGVYERQGTLSADATDRRFWIRDDDWWFEHPADGGRIVLQHESGRPDLSLVLQFANHYNYVSNLRFLSTSTGGSARLEFRDAGSGYTNIHGGTYTDSSRADTKEDFSDFRGGRALIRAARPRSWRRKPPTGRRPIERRRADGTILIDSEAITGEESGPLQLGVVIEECPPEWQTRDETGALVGVQYAAQIASLIAAVQELDADVEQLKKGRAA